ncbi:N-ethylmaleimide reductase [Acaryochloris thomasi RCC1774]|uniref:N-ethylmaleimide reductase n=1 Tax=Acaryochloris thomasi RCC1774 TaxID=1764569 RepID=A0A2W1JK37_9CYAN|nr:alkene reductase [Acaryochloris thomasi]PZD73793.1 N-ethylmaleimide reductase [Acaryochloris thomasi RCC1774]
MQNATLFQPLQLGAINLENRIIMAPLTRGRAGVERIPNELMVEYYQQRTSAGLIISEATQISEAAAGWAETPGIYSDAQVKGWQAITNAVHQRGGKIVLQLWHTGRASHPDFQPGGIRPISASEITPLGEVHTPLGKKPYVTPRAIDTEEISGIVEQYAEATRKAKSAGFDGVEIHAANGYLIDQFLRDGSNQRTDAYGGSIANRARFLLEVTEGVVNAWSADRVGIRLSTTSSFNDMRDSDPVATFTHVAEALNAFQLAYLHVLEALPGHMLAEKGEPTVYPHMRKGFQGPMIINGGYDAVTGGDAIATHQADAIAYGVPFIANPDLPERFAQNADLNAPDPDTFYTSGPEGYTDYPTLRQFATAS